MPKTLVTGAPGLIGSAVVRHLLQRGDDVRATVRSSSRRDNLEGLEIEQVELDLLDRRAVRRALKDVDRVFHVAGLMNLRATPDQLFRANVEVTRSVLEECLRAGVGRVVHTSSMVAVGAAPRHATADETQVFRSGRFGLPFVNAKHEAETEALRLAAQGLPVVIVNPGHVFGRGDVNRSSTDLVRRFLRGELPAYVDGAINIVDVEDVAAGHLLADEKGEVGERYLLGNRNFTVERLLADLGRLSGIEPPALKLPLPAALAAARSLDALPGRTAITETEVRAMSLWWAFRSTKAKRELGYKPSHHEDTLVSTIAWYRDREPLRMKPRGARQPFALRAAGFGLRRAASVVGRFSG